MTALNWEKASRRQNCRPNSSSIPGGRTSRTPEHPRATARYAGTCARCEHRYEPGTRIAHYYEGWSHVCCPREKVTDGQVLAAQAKWPQGPLWERTAKAQATGK